MSDEETEADKEFDRLKASRASYAGWLTRSLNKVSDAGSAQSVAVLQALQGRISGQLGSLQRAHDLFVEALLTQTEVDEAESWMDEYFEKATFSLKEIASSIKCMKSPKIVTEPVPDPSLLDAGGSSVPPSSVDQGTTSASGSTTGSQPIQSVSGSAASTPYTVQSGSVLTGLNPVAQTFVPTSGFSNLAAVGGYKAMDAWIDELVEGYETIIPSYSASPDLPSALARLEIERDLPRVEMPVFDGSPLLWPRFVEQFHVQVHLRIGLTDTRRMDLLQSHVKGEAKKLIEGLSYTGRNYGQALKELKFAFGHRVTVARAYIDGVTSAGVVQSGDAVALRDFYISVRDCNTTLKQLNYYSDFWSGEVLQRAARRIPFDKRSKWNDFVRKTCCVSEPSMLDLQKWLKNCIDSEFGPYALPTRQQQQPKSSAPPANPGSVKHTTLNTNASFNESVDLKSCPLCTQSHHVSRCPEYQPKSAEDRYACAMNKRLCYNCLYPGHRIEACKSQNVCREEGCGKRHHTSLHRNNSSETKPSYTSAKCMNTLQGNTVSVYFQVLPVIVWGANGRRISTHAVLDSASDVTLISTELAKDLGLRGRSQTLTVNTMTSTEVLPSRRVAFSVKAQHDPTAAALRVEEAWTRNGSFCGVSQILSPVRTLKHIDGVELSDVNPQSVKILIGANVPKAHIQMEVREGNTNEPMAIHTKLGWCLMGGVATSADKERRAVVNLLSSGDQLSQQVEAFWQTESFGVRSQIGSPMSVEDKKAEATLVAKTRIVAGHYEVPMLWRHPDVSLPNNKAMAEKRFSSLTRRLSADPVLGAKYSDVLNGYIERGYARKLTKEEATATSKRTWYLPHHCVINPKKPKKVRVVFDAAAPLDGVSLNSQLVTGPDMLNSLFGLLQRFRMRPVALVADIEAMFHQVRVSEADSDSLRFLWKNDITRPGPPAVYKMLVHIFGAVDSPTCANYALKRAALDADLQKDSLAVQTVLRDFYVDDMLKSIDDESTATSLASEVANILQDKGFHLTKWMSSSRSVLSGISKAERAVPELDLDLGELPVERALGVGWNVQQDGFVFNPVQRDCPITRRGIVSVVSSIFDPCGFLAPVVFKAKCLIQDIWRSEVGWDDAVSEVLCTRWKAWQGELRHLADLCIPRHHGLLKTGCDIELHIFCDASEAGFAAVAYLRFVDAYGQIKCSFVAAKTHVAPIKQVLTIPKLELQGAVMAVRLWKVLKEELGVPLAEVLFWTDAITILRYINNESMRWKIFVANRVSEIREETHPSQWHYVSTTQNPADHGSRGLSVEEIKTSFWMSGPGFLWQPRVSWPEQPVIGPPVNTDENLKKYANVNVLTAQDTTASEKKLPFEVLVDPEKFSSWRRLLGTTAWVSRAVQNFLSPLHRFKIKAKTETNLLCVEIRAAEMCLMKRAQSEHFPKDLESLSSGGEIEERSKLRPLAPFFDPVSKVIKVGGRLSRSALPEEPKHQILLPYGHHVTRLILRQTHRDLAHCGPEHLIAAVRQRFWPVKCRMLARSIMHECFDCRRRKVQPVAPVMSDLPAQRTAGFTRPFQYTGLDYFGPLFVKRGRATVKRWCCLFTCLVTRALHLELADSLGTDDFILVLRRFISRRGRPSELFSDNATNFKGAERELQENLSQMDHHSVRDFLLQSATKWSFIPPHAPHFGGVWERLVRSVKGALKAVLKNQCVTETVLQTTLCEMEAVVNSRPVTYNSEDPHDLTAITPGHFLYGGPPSVTPPGEFAPDDIDSRRRWRQAQTLADQLWRRWLKEYLPTLTCRKKWTKEQRQHRVNDLVMLVDDNLPRGQWLLGRVVEVVSGHDGRVRVVKVKTSQGTYTRPVVKVCLLEEAIM